MFVLPEDDGAGRIPLCLDCNLKLAQVTALQLDLCGRMFNYHTAEAEAALGVGGILPRFPERQVIQGGSVTLNNIRLDRSVVGVLNTGTIETVDAAVTALGAAHEEGVADAVKALAEAVAASTGATAEQKNQVLEILSVLATEATAPKEKRRSAAMRPLLQELSTHVGAIASLAPLWLQYGPVLVQAFRNWGTP